MLCFGMIGDGARAFLPRVLMAGAIAAVAGFAPTPGAADDLTPQQAKQIGVDAYIYGYALMTSDVTGKAFINTTALNPQTFQAPINQFVNIPKYPPADYKGVTAPNADTLYSAAFLDVSKDPILLSYPDMKGRYFLFPIYSQWTDVLAAPGKRTLGTGAQTIAITGPNWHGTLPSGVTHEVRSPTNSVFIIGRVYADGTPQDYAEVNAEQKEFKLVPLSSYGKSYTPRPERLTQMRPALRKRFGTLSARWTPRPISTGWPCRWPSIRRFCLKTHTSSRRWRRLALCRASHST